MKRIETKGGQIFEYFQSLKEVQQCIMDCYIDNKDFLSDDSSLYIRYKDGTEYYITGTLEEGKFKKTGIETVIENNPCTTAVYGPHKIYNIDNIDETYSKANDDEGKIWNIDIA